MSACPSELALEAYLLAPERSGARDHVGACAGCQDRLAELRRLGDEFQREVYPATVAAVVREGAAASPARRPWIALAGGLAAAAAALLFLRATDRGPWRPRLDLSVYVQAPGGAAPLRDGAEVPAGAALRFAVKPGAPCALWVLSVDAAGEVARLYPPKGDRASEAVLHPPGEHELPTGAVLEPTGGPRRIFAVCTRSPVPWLVVKQAAADTLGKGEDAVRSTRSIQGLPAGSRQTTVLLETRS